MKLQLSGYGTWSELTLHKLWPLLFQDMLRIQERDRSEAMEGQLSEARRQVESLQHEKAESQVEQVSLPGSLDMCAQNFLHLQVRLRTELERKEAQLEEKREQVLQAKNEVDRVMGELIEARQTVGSLRSQVDTLEVRSVRPGRQFNLACPPAGGAPAERDSAGRTGEHPPPPLEGTGVVSPLTPGTVAWGGERARSSTTGNHGYQVCQCSAQEPELCQATTSCELSSSVGQLVMSSTHFQPIGLQVNLPLTFTPTSPAVFGVNSAKAVMLGNNVIVAGGNADVDNQQQVMFYRPEKRVWGTLGRYNLCLFGMAVLGGNRMLVLVGGYDLTTDTYSNSLVQWDHKGRYWRPIFRPMPTARSDAAAVGYKGYLVVAGGSNGEENLTVVEVLNTQSVQWSTVAPLPAPIEGLVQSVPLEDAARPEADTWYLMGWETGLRQPAHTFSISLHRLSVQLEGGESAGWAMLPPPPLACCGAVIFRGCLLAVGGKDRHGGRKKDVHLYLPGTCEWLRVAELPVAKHNCCCFPLSSVEFMVIGGSEATQFSTRVDIARPS